jgi:putative flippase GtrA
MSVTTRRARLGKFARFAIVGGLSTLLYGIVSASLIANDHVSPTAGSAIGYLASIPFNYALQRGFAFQSRNPPRSEFGRYLLVHASNLALSTLSMHAITAWLHAEYWIGIVATMLLVPVIVFIVLDRWVFNTRPEASSRPSSPASSPP